MTDQRTDAELLAAHVAGDTDAFYYSQNRTSSPQLQPVVVPQSSHTMQWPLTFIRIELQLLH